MYNKVILTKEKAAEIIFRTQLITPENKITIDRCIANMQDLNDVIFIKRFRKATDLNLCLFAPNLFYIKYN